MIKAEVVLASNSPHAKTLYTLQLRYPWFIHGECKTHRLLSGFTEEGLYELVQDVGFMDDKNLSRNASSNRAIPLRKMLEEARSDELRAEPVKWGTEQKGMSPGDELDDAAPFAMLFDTGEEAVEGMATRRRAAKHLWRAAALKAAEYAEELHAIGLHKSLCNRLVMPYTHANVIVTATELDNFFGLRLQADVDPTMRALAEAMWVAVNEAKPQLLQPGEWHLPFIYEEDAIAIGLLPWKPKKEPSESLLLRVSVARCARVSYMSHDTGRRSTVEEDLALYDRLLGGLSDPTKPLHASPAEHQATPDDYKTARTTPINARWGWQNTKEHGNLVGWRQYRKMLPGEDVAPLPEAYRR